MVSWLAGRQTHPGGAMEHCSLAVVDACWLEPIFFLLFIKTDGVLWFIIKNEQQICNI